MGLTERHWFENEEPELTERQLEDIVYENKRAYDRGYAKGYSARDNEIVRCKDCKNRNDSLRCPLELLKEQLKYTKVFTYSIPDDWFCADGVTREVKNE